MAVFLIAAIIVFVSMLDGTSAQAAKRAFLVGIDNYTAGLPKLATANTDVTATADRLAQVGFKSEVVKDVSRAELEQRWLEFRSSLSEGDVVLFYFAGHGLQVDGTNYLLPADTPADANEVTILKWALSFHEMMADLEARKPLASIYILDACRKNPFSTAATGAQPGKLGQARGLAKMESVLGAFVIYSAGPDEEAVDSVEGDRLATVNSLFARHLLPLLSSAGLSLLDIIKRVQVDVEADARRLGHRQRPAYFDGIVGQYFLAQLDSAGLSPGEANRPGGRNVIRLGGFATWDDNCQSRPAPRVSVTRQPRVGRVLTRFENVTVAGAHFGKACSGSVLRGIAVYYVVDGAAASGIDTIGFTVNHWALTQTMVARETFEIDLAGRFSRRIGAAPGVGARQ